MVKSADPDDRDAASEMIRARGDPKGDELIQFLLNDHFPYIQLDACEHLLGKFPEAVVPVLQKLTIIAEGEGGMSGSVPSGLLQTRFIMVILEHGLWRISKMD